MGQKFYGNISKILFIDCLLILLIFSVLRSNIDITDEERNKTLVQNNITQINEESHEYYNSTIVQNENFTNYYRESIYADCSNLTINKLLSKSHRRAMTVKLPFQFYFYGHPINNITIATGGFLYAGEP